MNRFLLFLFVILFTPTLYSQSGSWALVMSKTSDGPQMWRTRSYFPKKEIKEYWDKDYRISSLNYGEGKWALVMTKGNDYPQIWRTRSHFPKEEIKEYWDKDYRISSLTYGQGKWALVMTKDNDDAQIWRTKTYFPKEEIQEFWDKDYKISSLSYGDGKWALVMTKNNIGPQMWRTRSYFPKKEIKDYWDKGYEISSLSYGNGKWALVMTKQNDHSQIWRTRIYFPKKEIEENWEKGYKITSLTYAKTTNLFANDTKNTPKKSIKKIKKQKKDIPVKRIKIDTNIPKTTKVNKNTFVVIIGNENYKREQNVPFAINDATIFKQYVNKTLGVPEDNIHLVHDATLGDLMSEIKWITNITKAWKGEANIIFYYAGHGMPDEESKDAFILPVDGVSEIPETGIKLTLLYEKLNKYRSNQVIVLLDACFSGAARKGMLSQTRGLKIQPKEEKVEGNLIVLSAATGKQSAYDYKEKEHGMFTYFLLKRIRLYREDTSLGDLYNYIHENVTKTSTLKNSKPQNPGINISHSFKNSWKNRKLAY